MTLIKYLFFASFVLVTSTTVALPVTAQKKGISFRTPSGFSTCVMHKADVTCIANIKTENIPPKPTECTYDWGGVFSINTRGKVSWACYSGSIDFDFNKYTILKYGSSLSMNGITCTSRKTGLTCINRDNRGWVISRENQRFF
jgi:hypothetical protein